MLYSDQYSYRQPPAVTMQCTDIYCLISYCLISLHYQTHSSHDSRSYQYTKSGLLELYQHFPIKSGRVLVMSDGRAGGPPQALLLWDRKLHILRSDQLILSLGLFSKSESVNIEIISYQHSILFLNHDP